MKESSGKDENKETTSMDGGKLPSIQSLMKQATNEARLTRHVTCQGKGILSTGWQTKVMRL